MKAKLERDIEDTRERIAAYNAGALIADQLAEHYGSHGWSASRVAAKIRERITSSREQLIKRIHRAGPLLTADESRGLLARAASIGPDDTATHEPTPVLTPKPTPPEPEVFKRQAYRAI